MTDRTITLSLQDRAIVRRAMRDLIARTQEELAAQYRTLQSEQLAHAQDLLDRLDSLDNFAIKDPRLTVYVPADRAAEEMLGIAPGSAIVGSQRDGSNLLTIDYEGGIYARVGDDMADFSTRLLHAAGRHMEHYPTRARQHVDPRRLRAVGTYEPARKILVQGDGPASSALEAWVYRWKPAR